MSAWAWRVLALHSLQQVGSLMRLLVWFTWPAWLLALPAYREWLAAALAEPWIVAQDEVDEPALVDLR